MGNQIADKLILISLVLFFWQGWTKGFIRALINPFSFIVAAICGIIYLDLVDNLRHSLSILIVGTIVLSFFINGLFYLSRLSIEKQYRNYIFIGSRICGSILNLGWKAVLLITLLLFIHHMPFPQNNIKKFKKDFEQSRSISFIKNQLVPRLSLLKHYEGFLLILKDPQRLQSYKRDSRFKEFFEDKRMKDLVKNLEKLDNTSLPSILKFFEDHTLTALLFDDTRRKELLHLSLLVYSNQ